MGSLLAVIATGLHIALCLAGAPLLWGGIEALCARMRGERGASPLQPYRRLIRLLGKTALLPDTATDMFALWPMLACLALAVAVMLIPGFCTGLLTARAADYVTIIGLFALGRAGVMLGGLETGAAFGGMGAARLAWLGLGMEAALLVLLLVFAKLTGHTDLNAMAVDGVRIGFTGATGLALAAMLVIAVIATSDRPTTGRELTMARNAVALEYSGRQLAWLEYADMLRLLAWMNLIICIFIPFGMGSAQAVLSWPLGLVLWCLKLFCLAVGMAVFTVIRAEIRWRRAPAAWGLALVLGVLASMLLVIVAGAGG